MTTRSRARSRLQQTKTGTSTRWIQDFVFDRKPYLTATILGLISVGVVVFILTSISPQSIADFPFPRSYGALVLSVGLCVFLLSSVLLLQRRRATLVTVWVVTLLFLKLQQFSLPLQFVLGSALLLLLSELLITRLTNRA